MNVSYNDFLKSQEECSFDDMLFFYSLEESGKQSAFDTQRHKQGNTVNRRATSRSSKTHRNEKSNTKNGRAILCTQ